MWGFPPGQAANKQLSSFLNTRGKGRGCFVNTYFILSDFSDLECGVPSKPSSFPPFSALLAKVVRAFLTTYFILSDLSALECGDSFQAKQFSSFLCAIGKGRGWFLFYQKKVNML